MTENRNDKTILVVDDEKVNIYLISSFLKEEGYKYITIQDSREVIETVSKKKPDAIIMDIMMPWIRGDELATQLKSSIATKQIPIILVTADVMQEQDGLQAEYFIRRPIVNSVLLSALNDVLSE